MFGADDGDPDEVGRFDPESSGVRQTPTLPTLTPTLAPTLLPTQVPHDLIRGKLSCGSSRSFPVPRISFLNWWINPLPVALSAK